MEALVSFQRKWTFGIKQLWNFWRW